MNPKRNASSRLLDLAGSSHRLVIWANNPPPGFTPLRWGHSAVRIIIIVVREMQRNRLSLRTGALTYAMLLSMVPLLAMSTAVVKGLGGGDQLRHIVFAYIDTLDQTATPADRPILDHETTAPLISPVGPATASSDLTGHLRAATDRVFDYVDRTSFATLGTFGILGVFLSVILVLGQIETAMNTIWHVKDSRSLLRKIADYLTLMVLLPIAVNVALAAGTVLTSQTLSVQLDRIVPATWIQSLLLGGVPILFLATALYVAYIFFPNTKVGSIPTMIGALIAGSSWFVTQNLFISLQIGVANYNAIYGSFATIPLFLVWIYLGLLFVLLGAQIAYAIQHLHTYQLVPRTHEPSLLLSAAFDICATVETQFDDNHGTTVEDILLSSPCYPRDVVETARDKLIAADLIHHSRESGKMMPSEPSGRFNHQRIIGAILGTDPPDTDGGRKATRVIAAAIDAQASP